MKIVFIYNGAENLGIEHLSSFLKSKGHTVDLLFDPAPFSGGLLLNNQTLADMFSIDKKIINLAVKSKPDIIGFSVFSGNYRWCLSIAREIKKISNIPIVFGGVHATAVPDRVLENDCVDFLIVGEGELAILDLVENIGKYLNDKSSIKTPNLCFKHDGKITCNEPRAYIRDLDALPYPDKPLFFDKIPLLAENYLIMTSRGCPYNCTFCSNNMYKTIYSKEKQQIRRRSPDNVIEELLFFTKKGQTKNVNLNDDVFTSSVPWLEEFIEKYKSKINLPFYCQTHPLMVNKEVISLLKEGGCRQMTLGIQSGSQRIRKELFNRKGTDEKLLQAIADIKEAGIQISLDNIFGAPTENEEDLKECYKFYTKAKVDRVQTFWLTYYPKVKIIDHAKDEGLLTDADIGNIENGYVGFTHGTGSVDKERIDIYLKYQLLFHLGTLIKNNFLNKLVSAILVPLPFKPLLIKIIILANSIKIKDDKLFYFIKFLLSKKCVP